MKKTFGLFALLLLPVCLGAKEWNVCAWEANGNVLGAALPGQPLNVHLKYLPDGNRIRFYRFQLTTGSPSEQALLAYPGKCQVMKVNGKLRLQTMTGQPISTLAVKP